MFTIKVSDEIYLKLAGLDDAEELFSLIERNREFLRHYLAWVDLTVSQRDSEEFIKESIEKFEEGSGYSLCIVYQGKIVGAAGLTYIDPINKKTEISYWLSTDHHGKGIMKRCCQAFIDFSFNELELHRIEIRCAIHNRASQRIPESLGFSKEGVLSEASYLNGKFFDTIIYGLISKIDRFDEI